MAIRIRTHAPVMLALTSLAFLSYGPSVTSMANTTSAAQKKAPAPVAGYRVVKVYPHDRQAFTQGLQYVDGVLYEGTGQHGQSGIRKVKLETGEVLQHQPLDAKYFGEGITVWGDTIVQLTWQSEIGFVYDKATLQADQDLSATRGEGLGPDARRHAPHHERRVARRCASWIPVSFKETGRVIVRDNGVAIVEAERTRVRQRRDPGQRLADLTHRAHLAEDRRRDWVD